MSVTHGINDSFDAIFHRIFQVNGMDSPQRPLPPLAAGRFEQLTYLLQTANQQMNLTALRDVPSIVALHYADCAQVALDETLIPSGARVLDVGCGGGFPTLPLALLRPDVTVTALDSTEKKLRFVTSAAQTLHLDRVHTLWGRAEELAQTFDHRECYDVVISRAVARLHLLDELCLPFVRQSGLFLAMKGALAQEEAKEAAAGCARLGGDAPHLRQYTLKTDQGEEQRAIVWVRKLRSTPVQYPRAFAQIKKHPL